MNVYKQHVLAFEFMHASTRGIIHPIQSPYATCPEDCTTFIPTSAEEELVSSNLQTQQEGSKLKHVVYTLV